MARVNWNFQIEIDQIVILSPIPELSSHLQRPHSPWIIKSKLTSWLQEIILMRLLGSLNKPFIWSLLTEGQDLKYILETWRYLGVFETVFLLSFSIVTKVSKWRLFDVLNSGHRLDMNFKFIGQRSLARFWLRLFGLTGYILIMSVADKLLMKPPE